MIRYQNKSTLCVILARGSSKRLKKKVLLKINKKHLFLYGLKTALKSNVNRVILSTEDTKIKKIAEKNNISVPFLRPKKLAKDFANDFDIVYDAYLKSINFYKEKYKYLVVIQATTPFIRKTDINNCVRLIKNYKRGCVFSSKIINEHPRWAWYLNKNKTVKPILNSNLKAKDQHRQNLKKVIFPNGGIWALNIKDFIKQKSLYCKPLRTYVMPDYNSIDIDTMLDYEFAKIVSKKLNY